MSSRTEGGPRGVPRVWLLALLATVAAAAALRLAGLDSSLWYDEIVTLVVSARLPVREIVTEYPNTNVHPLYSLLAHTSLVAFGESAWALRLPAALFGIGAVVLSWGLGRRLVSVPAGWAGATVLAVSYHHIWFSQNARGYTLMGCMALASTWLLLRARDSGRWSDYAWYALACAAGVYAHLTMALVVAGQAGAVGAARLLRWPDTEQVPAVPAVLAWTAAACVSIACYVPFMPGLLDSFGGPAAPTKAAEVATASWAVGEAVRSLLAGSGVVAAAVGLAVAAIGGLALARRRPLATALLVMPAIVTLGAILALGQPVRPRFFFFLAGAAAIFVGQGLASVAARLGRMRVPGAEGAWLVALTLTLVALSLPSLPRNYAVPKQDFEGVVAYLEAAEADGASVAIADPACLPFERYYRKSWPCVIDAATWPAPGGAGAPVLVAYTLVEYAADPAIRRSLQTACEVRRRFPGTLGGGDFTVCEVRP